MAAGSNDPSDRPSNLAPRDLLTRIRSVTGRARASGALEPIETEPKAVDDGGIRFELRRATALARKRYAARKAPSQANPFLPYDEALFVADVGARHVCLLNKFPVLPDHTLIVTRGFEPQESAIRERDFRALADCLERTDGLGFYNAGAASGASQPHKHLQFVPVRVGSGPGRAPLEPTLLRSLEAASGPLRCAALPFRHALAAVAPSADAAVRARELEALYHALLGACDWSDAQPYNLLVTRAWMLLVPRRTDCCEGVEVNALGFAGALFARDDAQLAQVERLGPIAMLRSVTLT